MDTKRPLTPSNTLYNYPTTQGVLAQKTIETTKTPDYCSLILGG